MITQLLSRYIGTNLPLQTDVALWSAAILLAVSALIASLKMVKTIVRLAADIRQEWHRLIKTKHSPQVSDIPPRMPTEKDVTPKRTFNNKSYREKGRRWYDEGIESIDDVVDSD